MYTFLLYILKVSLSLAAFYMFYKLLCSRDTLHRFNRWLLLFILALSSVIPFIYIDFGVMTREASVVFKELVMTVDPVEVETTAVVVDEVVPTLWQRIPWQQIPWRMLLVGVYFIGLLVCLVQFIVSLVSIVLLIRSSKRRVMADGTILVTHDKAYGPFSWMRYVIASEKDLDENFDMILAHERAHIRLHHSWDLLFVQLCAIVQWFNPAVWLLKRELEAIHEYEADSETLLQGFDARQYQLRLFEEAVGVKFNTITNNFNNCSTKKRIIMMMKRQTSPWARMKALFVLPVALAAVTVISCTSPKEKKVEHAADSDVAVVTDGKGGPLLIIALPGGTEITPVGDWWVDEYNKDQKGFLAYFNLTPDNLNSENLYAIESLSAEEAMAAYGDRGANGAVRFRINDKGKQEILDALRELAKSKGEDEPLMVNIKHIEQGEVYQVVEEQPEYPGGMEAMMKFLQENVKYPEQAQSNGVQGRVIVQFVVNKDGSVSNDTVVRSVDPLLDAEALRVVRAMPNWTPGKQKGEPVRVRFTLPVTFRLDGGISTKKANPTTETVTTGDEVFNVVEEGPIFLGGHEALMKYIQKEIKYPKEAQEKGVQGRVVVQFVVKKDGSISDAKVLKSVDPLCDAEALRVVNAMPNWKPGKQRGEPVNVQFTLPVVFRLQ